MTDPGTAAGAAIAPAGGWTIDLVEAGAVEHPGWWVGPDEPELRWSPINVLVLRRPKLIVLVDAGPGFAAIWWTYGGYESYTESALAAIGVMPAEVDLVVLTHLDDDHAAGAVVGSWPDNIALAFPRARVVVHKDALATARAADPDEPHNVGTRLVALLDREHRLVVVDDGAEVAPSVHIYDMPGHRAGHVCVHVDGPDPFVYAADTFHHELHVGRPDWDAGPDDDPEQALATRRWLLNQLADTGARVAISHGTGPYAFRVVREADGFLRAIRVRSG